MKLSFMAFMCEIRLIMEGEWSEEKSVMVEELIRAAGAAGYEGIDLIEKTIENMTPERIKKNLQENGLSLASVICVSNLAEPEISDEEAQAPYIKAMDTAVFLGCSHLMLVPGFFLKTYDTEKIREVLRRRFKNLVKEADNRNIYCMIEDDPDLKLGLCALSDVRNMLTDVPGLKLVYDSANMIVAGEEPLPYYEQMKDFIIHMHIKDIAVCDDPSAYRDLGADGTYYASAPHGTGMVDFEKLFQSFGRDGYKSWLALEYVPTQGANIPEEIKAVYRKFAALAAKYSVGFNMIGLIPRLETQPYEEVWKTLGKIGLESVEVCAIPDHCERIREYAKEAAKKYPVGMPDCLAKGDNILAMIESIQNGGLEVHSCHLLLGDAYPELIEESVPYLKKIAKKTGVRQFVISCMLTSASIAKEYLPHVSKAATALKEDGITLCYHNHHMDSTPLENGKTALEMVLEECPDCMLQLDVGWAWYGNMDSLQFIKDHGDRIASVHLKDLTSDARERNDLGRFPAIGSGVVPMEEIIHNLHLCNIAPGRLIIDQDASLEDIYADIASGIDYISGV